MSRKAEWSRIQDRLAGQLSEEEQRIVAALAEGKTMPEVGRMLGQHRSMIWRKTQRIKARVENTR
jgi:DNA-binding NarL/FixJ family response regulator